jgi:hypothetical protein
MARQAERGQGEQREGKASRERARRAKRGQASRERAGEQRGQGEQREGRRAERGQGEERARELDRNQGYQGLETVTRVTSLYYA